MNVCADNITKIVSLNGGRLVGKTRFQKTAYFLEEFGVGFGFNFEYYHYGPYSEDLSVLMSDAEILGICGVEWNETSTGTRYAVFSSPSDELDEHPNDKERKKILDILSSYDAVTLELASTADFLKNFELFDDEWEETIRRKREKATTDRIKRAKTLLSDLENIID